MSQGDPISFLGPKLFEDLLACPLCLGRFGWSPGRLTCHACGFQAGLDVEGIINMMPSLDAEAKSLFDACVTGMMRHGTAESTSDTAFYEQQRDWIHDWLGQSSVILDVGCGPNRRYDRPSGLVIGLDSSAECLAWNDGVDVRLHGTALALPLPRASVDAVLCLYSLHHMIGERIEIIRAMVHRVMSEFDRVLRPGGQVIVCEVSPWWGMWALERLTWDLLRRWFPGMLTMFFWRRADLEAVAKRALRPGTSLQYQRITVSPFLTFPFAFTVPTVRLPRFLYPFEIGLYRWRLPA